MTMGSKTAMAILAGFIWIFSVKSAVALPFSAMLGSELPIRAQAESAGRTLSAPLEPVFLGPHPVSPTMAQYLRLENADASARLGSRWAKQEEDRPFHTVYPGKRGPSPALDGVAMDGFALFIQGLMNGESGGGQGAESPEMNFSFIRGNGRSGVNSSHGFADLSQKPLLSGIMDAELGMVGMACSNPLTGPGPGNPATFTLMATGFAGMAAGRFLIARF
jgi:hypothetical protein